jgi:hypothetical protein
MPIVNGRDYNIEYGMQVGLALLGVIGNTLLLLVFRQFK